MFNLIEGEDRPMDDEEARELAESQCPMCFNPDARYAGLDDGDYLTCSVCGYENW